MLIIELFFYFVLAGVAIVTWERFRQCKNNSSLFFHFKMVYTHLFLTLLLSLSTMYFFGFVLNATENEVGVATLTTAICSWFVFGYFLRRND